MKPILSGSVPRKHLIEFWDEYPIRCVLIVGKRECPEGSKEVRKLIAVAMMMSALVATPVSANGEKTVRIAYTVQSVEKDSIYCSLSIRQPDGTIYAVRAGIRDCEGIQANTVLYGYKDPKYDLFHFELGVDKKGKATYNNNFVIYTPPRVDRTSRIDFTVQSLSISGDSCSLSVRSGGTVYYSDYGSVSDEACNFIRSTGVHTGNQMYGYVETVHLEAGTLTKIYFEEGLDQQGTMRYGQVIVSSIYR